MTEPARGVEPTTSGGYAATSERVCPDDYADRDDDYLIYVFHTATYDYAAPLVAGGRVLDFGCGTGYGDARIANRCAHVTGIDVSADAVAYAGRHHAHPDVDFTRIEPVDDAPLPYADEAFDAVLSFQVIEHVPDPRAYLAEAARVTRPGGVLVLATPDRRSRLWRGQRPWNRYHRTEFAPDELAELVAPWYEVTELAGMGAAERVLAPELARTRRLRRATAVFTFPGAPEGWRQRGLELLKRVETRRRGGAPPSDSTDLGTLGESVAAPPPAARSFDERDIVIAPGVWPSTNVVLTARRR